MDTSYCLDLSSVSEANRRFEINTATYSDARNIYASVDVQPQILGYVPLVVRTGDVLILDVQVDEHNNIIISDNEFVVYGIGKTKEEALNDYKVSFVEYFELVSENNDEQSLQLVNRLKQFLPENH